jgi:hypothetical protein
VAPVSLPARADASNAEQGPLLLACRLLLLPVPGVAVLMPWHDELFL